MSITPLGLPVVPDVYIRRWTSSAEAVSAARAASWIRRSARATQPSGADGVTAARTNVASIPLVASSARATSDSSHTSARASECSRMKRTSGAARRQLIGMATAPRWFAANRVSRNSGQL